MELTVFPREIGKKSDKKKMRREGNIPAVLYSLGKEGKGIVVDGIAFKKICDMTVTGTLCSKVFSLSSEGAVIKAIVKEIHYHPTTYAILHLDFQQLHEDALVTLNIPINFVNAVNCAGVKLGGVLRRVIRKLKVTCLPKDIPDCFEIDVGQLLLGQTLKLDAICIPKGVVPKASLDEVAVVVARK